MIKLINIIKETKIIPKGKEIPNQYIDIIDKLTSYIFEDNSGFDLEKPMSNITNPNRVSEIDEETIEKFNKFMDQYPDGTAFLTNNLEIVDTLIPAPGAPKSSYRCKITILKNRYPYPNDNIELPPAFKNSMKVEIPYIDSDGKYYTGWFNSDGKYQGDIQNFDEDGNKI
jgi:hypothetical protein